MKCLQLFLSRSLRFKIMSGLLMSLVPMIAIIGIIYVFDRNSAIETSKGLTKVISSKGANEINAFFKTSESIFADWTKEDLFGMSIEFQTTEELQKNFMSLLTKQNGFALFALTDTTGKILEFALGHKTSDENAASFKGQVLPDIQLLASMSKRCVLLVKSDIPTKLGQNYPFTVLFAFKAHDSKGNPNGYFLAYLDWSEVQKRILEIASEMKENRFHNSRVMIMDISSGAAAGYSEEDKVGSILPDESSILKTSGQDKIEQAKLPQGVEYIASFPIQIGGDNTEVKKESVLRLAVLVPEKDILLAVKKILWTLLGVAGIGAVIIIIIGFVISLSVTSPVLKGVEFAKMMSSGDFTQTLDISQKDEIGILAAALNTVVSTLGHMFQKIHLGSATLSHSSVELSNISEKMMEGAGQSSKKTESVAEAAKMMSSNMTSVAASMEEASTNISIAATAAEQMSSTINEIAMNTEKAAVITSGAVSQAKGASDKINELGRAAQEIGKVTETITEISEQTNLLALNATIEAARAGEAGKGFAVVANEIKELARQTASATQEIKSKIEGIQSSTSSTVTQIEQVSTVINKVNEIVSTIATAVEEQSVTTKEIVNNVVQTSQGIQDATRNVAESSEVSQSIARDIAEASLSVSEFSSNASHIHSSAQKLNELAKQLTQMVGAFKVKDVTET
ncbi:MAG: HAMP domain-containing methyl-accepting chemotaxis protein [Pseudomonadota bacterium]